MISVLLLPAFVVALLNRLGCVDIWWDLKALSWCPAPSISLCLGTSPIHLLASQPRGVTLFSTSIKLLLAIEDSKHHPWLLAGSLEGIWRTLELLRQQS